MKVFFDRRDIVSRDLTNASRIFQIELNKRHVERANQDIEVEQETRYVQETTRKMLMINKVFEHLVFHN